MARVRLSLQLEQSAVVSEAFKSPRPAIPGIGAVAFAGVLGAERRKKWQSQLHVLEGTGKAESDQRHYPAPSVLYKLSEETGGGSLNYVPKLGRVSLRSPRKRISHKLFERADSNSVAQAKLSADRNSVGLARLSENFPHLLEPGDTAEIDSPTQPAASYAGKSSPKAGKLSLRAALGPLDPAQASPWRPQKLAAKQKLQDAQARGLPAHQIASHQVQIGLYSFLEEREVPKGIEALAHAFAYELGDMKKAFKDIDHNKSSDLSFCEFIAGTTMLHLDVVALTGQNSAQIFRLLDMDASGSIDLEEFLRLGSIKGPGVLNLARLAKKSALSSGKAHKDSLANNVNAARGKWAVISKWLTDKISSMENDSTAALSLDTRDPDEAVHDCFLRGSDASLNDGSRLMTRAALRAFFKDLELADPKWHRRLDMKLLDRLYDEAIQLQVDMMRISKGLTFRSFKLVIHKILQDVGGDLTGLVAVVGGKRQELIEFAKGSMPAHATAKRR